MWKQALAEAAPVLEKTATAYWLGGAALSFAAWLADNRPEAERRAREAVLLNDGRASLFFFLLSWRYVRPVADDWLRRYLDTQVPVDIDPVAADLFLAACEGAFGSGGRRAAHQAAEKWVTYPLPENGDAEFGATRKRFLLSRAGAAKRDAFPLLRKYSPSWSGIEAGLDWAALQDGVASFYKEMTDTDASQQQDRVIAPSDPDFIMERRLREYMDEEGQLRRECRMSRLVVEYNGDMDAAAERLEREWPPTGNGCVFPVLLMDIVSGEKTVSPDTFRLMLALSRPWLNSAYERLEKDGKAAIPEKVSLTLNGWSGETARGENESDLLASYSRYCEDRHYVEPDRKPLWMEERCYIPAIMAILVTVLTASTILIPLIALGGFGYYFYTLMKGKEVDRASVGIAAEERRREEMATISACVAEVAAFRRQMTVTVREGENLRDRLKNFALGRVSIQYTDLPESTRPAPPVGVSPPAWDIAPPPMEARRKTDPLP